MPTPAYTLDRLVEIGAPVVFATRPKQQRVDEWFAIVDTFVRQETDAAEDRQVPYFFAAALDALMISVERNIDGMKQVYGAIKFARLIAPQLPKGRAR